jgi:AcrR family transcriptional regulator
MGTARRSGGGGESGAGSRGGTDVRWRERAIERSLRNARARAVTRSDRFIAAANELLQETGRTDFTVQEIVERSKMSLRSFYQHFASKDELLLALFEEVIVEWVERLRVQVYKFDDPVDQLRAIVLGMYGTVKERESAPSRALTIYHLRLAETHPSEFAHALAPQIDLIMEVVEAGVANGQFRRDIESAQMAMVLTQTLVSTLHMSVLGAHWASTPVSEEALWSFCLGGVSDGSGTTGRRAVASPKARRAARARA